MRVRALTPVWEPWSQTGVKWRGKECRNNLILILLWTSFIYIVYSLSGSGSSLIKKVSSQ